LIYTPIEDWSNDDVWLFLMQFPNPWGYDNKHLLTMYQGASADGECPLVVDSSTPSCGDSRFGCWVCTLVEKDKSMSAMIQNDQEKEWMLPLLELRNELDVADDRHLRDFRRLTGRVQLLNDQLRLIPGPYTQSSREAWLAKLLRAQKWIRDNGPESVREIQLITIDELETIRRIWVLEKHEIEDNIPTIYAECMGENYPGKPIDEGQPFGREQLELLREISGTNELHYQMVRELLNVERRYQTQAKRSKLFTDLEDAIKKGFFDGEEDATRYAVRQLNFSFPESDGEL
jgi:DNA sulfur modification protein DndC